MRARIVAFVAILLFAFVFACRTSPDVTHDSGAEIVVDANVEAWNPNGIDWKPYDEGLALAKAENKHVCLVLFTTWCPHCKNYSHVFADPRLVERAKGFVMIRLDADANAEIANRYRLDGSYIPRTYFLDADGNVDLAADTGRAKYKYFFDEKHADDLLRAMDVASPHVRR